VSRTAFVVDANVAILAFIDVSVLVPERIAMARAAARFMQRAMTERAELHVPELFDSEVRNAIYRDGIAKGLFSFDEGLTLLQTILNANWQRHAPEDERVYILQRDMQRTKSTGDAEFLAVAQVLSCALITADEALISTVEQRKIAVEVIDVAQHPWALKSEA
jgi:predicted nucleic acid-binding protein